ncbi:MAG TPA: EutN/CcmL family microcompartment protein [Bdellovibrionales bacterium]|nr:EutN/CcmL family microcompartment protein [Bdellovibrionales bacterium]
MILARVVGEVVSTQKEPTLSGLKLLLVQSVDLKGEPKGTVLVAADAVGAGVGEVVLYASGSSARQTAATKDRPVDSVIMAIVDQIDVRGERSYSKDQDAH